MTNWKIVHGSVKPQPIDTTSSSTVVYEHRDIKEETIENEDKTSTTQWVYEEREMTKEEYANLSSPVTQMLMQNLSDLEANVLELLV